MLPVNKEISLFVSAPTQGLTYNVLILMWRGASDNENNIYFLYKIKKYCNV